MNAMGHDNNGVAVGSTLWEMLVNRVALTPDNLAFADDHDRSFTWSEILSWTERTAAGFMALGIDNTTVVSWQLPTRVETVITSMALARLGVTQNPIIHLYRANEVGSLLRTTKARFFVVPGVWNGFDYAAMAAGIQTTNNGFAILDISAELPTGNPANLPLAPTDGEEVRWLYSTSGTTSEPKAVRHSDSGLIAAGIGLAKKLQPTSYDVGSIPFPYAHIGGPDYFVMMLHTGMPAVLLERFIPADAFALFRARNVTLTGGSTAHYLAAINDQNANPERRTMPSLKHLAGGGAPMPAEIYRQSVAVLGVPIRHGYGMTECPMICNGSVDDTDEQLANTEGAPIDGCEVLVVDDNEVPLAAGIDGNILVRGAMVAKGYLDTAATAESFRADGFFRTGDRGHLRADGHVKLTGRSKELIIRKGENISPQQIEDVLITHPSVGAVAVIGLPDPTSGERVCVVVETAAGTQPITFAEMTEHCRAAGLMIQKTPEQLEIVDALPRNPTLKILKRVLVERFSE